MKSPIEFLGDLYDYQYEYYRWFIHRRNIFGESTLENFKETYGMNIFENNDSENVGKLVTNTTLFGVAAGAGIAPIKYAMMSEIKAITFKRALPSCLGVIAFTAAMGLAYGTIVNATSKFRNNKNDSANHAIAALLTVPASGYYAKTNRLQWGAFNALLAAGVVAYLKYGFSGAFGNPKQQRGPISNFSPTSYRPQS